MNELLKEIKYILTDIETNRIIELESENRSLKDDYLLKLCNEGQKLIEKELVHEK